MKHWYAAKTGNHQGLIISEGDGRNVAVSYAKEDAPLIAAAPELLEALKDELGALNTWIYSHGIPDDVFDGLKISRDKIKKAIAKAEGKS